MSCHVIVIITIYYHIIIVIDYKWNCEKKQSSSSIRQTNVEGEKEKTEDMTKNMSDIGDYRKKGTRCPEKKWKVKKQRRSSTITLPGIILAN